MCSYLSGSPSSVFLNGLCYLVIFHVVACFPEKMAVDSDASSIEDEDDMTVPPPSPTKSSASSSKASGMYCRQLLRGNKHTNDCVHCVEDSILKERLRLYIKVVVISIS